MPVDPVFNCVAQTLSLLNTFHNISLLNTCILLLFRYVYLNPHFSIVQSQQRKKDNVLLVFEASK